MRHDQETTMRRGRQGGLCGWCGTESDAGLYYENALITLDFGVPAMPVFEPDTSLPVLCESCDLLASVVAAYREDQAFAERVYCAYTAAEALRSMGWQMQEGLKKRLERMKAAGQ